MNDETFSDIVKNMISDIRGKTPYDTGNLANTATKSASLGNGIIEIYVDEKIAEYFQYVNNYRNIYYREKRYKHSIKNGKIVKTPYWETKSKPNHNYHYFEKAFDDALQNLANRVGGVIVSD